MKYLWKHWVPHVKLLASHFSWPANTWLSNTKWYVLFRWDHLEGMVAHWVLNYDILKPMKGLPTIILCLTNHNGTYVISRWQITRYSLCVYNSQTTNIMLICWLVICQLLFITFYNTMENSLALCIDSISLDFLTQS